MTFNNYRQWQFKPLPKYTHFPPKEAEVWNFFIQSMPDICDVVYYDIPVGIGASPGNIEESHLRKDWQYLTSLKADAIGFKGLKPFLFECKLIGASDGIGQLLSYKNLLIKNYGLSENIILFYIANRFYSDVLKVCDDFNIITFETNLFI